MQDTTYDIIGIGNAIVDVVAPTDHAFLSKHDMHPGGMALVDAERANALYTAMPPGRESSGGSAANTCAVAAALGARVAYIGKVAADALGETFSRDIQAAGVVPSDDALVRPETRSRYWSMIWSGLTDAVRAVRPDGAVYTFWDYQAGCWARNRGLRIDHALLAPTVAERLVFAVPDKQARAEDTPSDHVPLVVSLA